MRYADPGNDFHQWRTIARALILDGVPPGEVLWEKAALVGAPVALTSASGTLKVPPAFVEFAKSVACHKDPSRWSLLYRMLWRITRGGERHLLDLASDPDVAKATSMATNVRREIHKMHAFVRFKRIDDGAETGRERFAAWFEPEHFIVEAAAPFFCKRFANMDWSIFNPHCCAHFIQGEFYLTEGMAHNPIESPDALESAWKTYYRSIFNPARLKLKAMQSEMPRRYWKNLPETERLGDLITGSRARVKDMLDREPRAARPVPKHAYLEKLRELSDVRPIDHIPDATSLEELRDAAAGCRACPLWENATCTVFGEGPADARIMLVGEQPGDREDTAGRVFVGPAGKLLDEALVAAGIDRRSAYLTNAVKHFKWRPRGKIRLHQKPDPGEIDACRPWLLGELRHVAPEILILLGATAARSALGRPIAVTKFRGWIDAPDLAPRVILTVHPSYLLRLPDTATREIERAKFIADLRLAVAAI
jgi:probable DNA metabolism protein